MIKLNEVKENIYEQIENLEGWLLTIEDQLDSDKEHSIDKLDKTKIKLSEILIEMKYEMSEEKGISNVKKDEVNEGLNRLKVLLDFRFEEHEEDFNKHRNAIVESVNGIIGILKNELGDDNELLNRFKKNTNILKSDLNILKVQLMDDNKKARLYDMLYEKKDEIKNTLDRYKKELNDQDKINRDSVAKFEEEVSTELDGIRDSINKLFHEIYF